MLVLPGRTSYSTAPSEQTHLSTADSMHPAVVLSSALDVTGMHHNLQPSFDQHPDPFHLPLLPFLTLADPSGCVCDMLDCSDAIKPELLLVEN